MLVSVNWLSQYIDLRDIDPKELAEKITRTGIEVRRQGRPPFSLASLRPAPRRTAASPRPPEDRGRGRSFTC